MFIVAPRTAIASFYVESSLPSEAFVSSYLAQSQFERPDPFFLPPSDASRLIEDVLEV